jgi:hypothetical protein
MIIKQLKAEKVGGGRGSFTTNKKLSMGKRRRQFQFNNKFRLLHTIMLIIDSLA